jgi:hypothetical protein
MGKDCGLDLFRDFEFDDITSAKPPDAKGVYVIRVRKPGMPPDEIIRNLRPHILHLGWKMAGKYLLDRIGRIEKIGDCPIIYIGSAGTNPGSRHTLAGQYRGLVNRHAIQFSIWALLYFGWELDFGWKAGENPKELEKDLKERYETRQRRIPPALVVR